VVIFEIQEIGTIGGYVSDISSRDVLETFRPQCVKLLEASNSDNTWLTYGNGLSPFQKFLSKRNIPLIIF
jgi:hypothetical protein